MSSDRSTGTNNIWVARFECTEDITRFIKEPMQVDGENVSRFTHTLQVKFASASDVLYIEYNDDIEKLMGLVPSQLRFCVKRWFDEKKLSGINTLILHPGECHFSLPEIDEPPLWYVGQFVDAELHKLRDQYTQGSVSEDFWTIFPETQSDLSELKKSGTTGDSQEDTVKYAIMLLCGIGYDEDKWGAQKLLEYSSAAKQMVHEALLAVGSLGYAAAWMQLVRLHCNVNDFKLGTPETRQYLEQAVELGSMEAKSILSGFLTKSYSNLGYDPDHKRAETLMLEMAEAGDKATYYRLSGLYQRGPLKNSEKAVYWTEKSALAEAHPNSFSSLASSYIDGDGVEKNLSKFVMYRYLSLCNSPIEYDIPRVMDKVWEKLDLCSLEQLETGRKNAKEWIIENAPNMERKFVELRDPFKDYIDKRKEG